MAVYVNSAAIILKIGIGTTAVVGGALFARGEIRMLTFFMFLIADGRLFFTEIRVIKKLTYVLFLL